MLVNRGRGTDSLKYDELLAKHQALHGQDHMFDEKRVEQHTNGFKHAGFPQWMNLLGIIQWLDYKHNNIKKYVILERLFMQLGSGFTSLKTV